MVAGGVVLLALGIFAPLSLAQGPGDGVSQIYSNANGSVHIVSGEDGNVLLNGVDVVEENRALKTKVAVLEALQGRVQCALVDSGMNHLADAMNLSTIGAVDLEYFHIGNQDYLAVSQFQDGAEFVINSTIFALHLDAMDPSGNTATPVQSILTRGAYGLSYFEIDGAHFLAFAESVTAVGASPPQVSTIYKWSLAESQFAAHQNITTPGGALEVEYFQMNGDHFLAYGMQYDFVDVYRWNGVHFEANHSISTAFGMPGPLFAIGAEHYLAIPTRGLSAGKIVRWSSSTAKFVDHQPLPTTANDVEVFSVGSNHYMVISQNILNRTAPINCTLHKWTGGVFVEIQQIPTTTGAVKVKSFQPAGSNKLLFAFAQHIVTTVFEFSSASEEFQLLQTIDADDSHQVLPFETPASAAAAGTFLAVANFGLTSHRTTSHVYRWNGYCFT